MAPSSSAIIAAAGGAVAVLLFLYNSHEKDSESRRQKETNKYEARIAKLEETRQAERTGRIRAEMKLRTCLKNQQLRCDKGDDTENGVQDNDVNEHKQQNNQQLQLQCIGTIISPYTKRMGTPRQGALVPSGRGYIQLNIPIECVDGLDMYSHAWILFTFHANTDAHTTKQQQTAKQQSTNGKSKQSKKGNNSTNNNNSMLNLSKTKIRPPRAPHGLKVGMLATRSPHRPNNIGLSLVQITSVDKKNKRLYISALDLVNGTPVYDVKPCVPWDIPGYYNDKNMSISGSSVLKVPSWVSQDDTLQSVQFTTHAKESLIKCIQNNKLQPPLYTMKNDGINGAIETICQILAQDPRASNSNGVNKRGTSSSTSPINKSNNGHQSNNDNKKKENDIYKMIFCSVEIEFRVNDEGVTVENVNDDLDLNSLDFVDGIPILLK